MAGVTWLASFPKSGNTWLRIFLATYKNDGNPIIPNALPREFEAADHQSEHYHAVSPCPVDKLTNTETLFLRGAVILKIMTECRTRPLLVKTHHARIVVDGVELIPQPFTSPSIYIVRDPRDMVLSFADWTSKSVDEAIDMIGHEKMIMRNPDCQAVFHWVGNWSSHVESWADAPDTLVVRYEDMHREPVETFSAVLEHIGVEVNEERVARSVAASSFDRMKAAEDRERFYELPPSVDRFFRTGTAGHWKAALTQRQAERIASEHEITMQRMDYL